MTFPELHLRSTLLWPLKGLILSLFSRSGRPLRFLHGDSKTISSFLISPSLVLLMTLHKLSTSQQPHIRPVHGESMFLQNVCIYLQDHMALQPRRPTTTSSAPREPQIQHITKLYSIYQPAPTAFHLYYLQILKVQPLSNHQSTTILVCRCGM
jgi:hypothetical protein